MPLSEDGLGNDDEEPAFPFSPELREDEPRLDRLPEAHLVGKDASTLGNAAEGEHDSIDLVRVRIDPALALRRCDARLLVAATAADEVLRIEAPLDRVKHAPGCHGPLIWRSHLVLRNPGTGSSSEAVSG
ncbi:MAG: hypothetical protein NT062_36330 [Proteobacteria bacterium]|nr:hypothetical protein [Pseudomonadota bacterium]